MTRDACSWCGSPGPFPTVNTARNVGCSAYCVRCVTVRDATGAFPPRTAAQRAHAVTQAQHRTAARKMAP